MAYGSERRAARRFSMALPIMVRVPGQDGPKETPAETRDISFRGLYFLMEEDPRVGNMIEFVLTLPKEITMAGDVHIRCSGEVVRVDDGNGRRGIAAKIDRYEFLPVQA